MGNVLDNIVEDKQDIKNQLGDLPNVVPAAKLFSEDIMPEHIVTKIEQKEYDGSTNVFILNSESNIEGLQAWYKLNGDATDSSGNGYDGTISGVPGTVGWWKLNGNANDSSGGGNNGTWNGTEAYDTGKQFTQAADFDGSSSINIGASNNFYTSSDTGATISVWIKPQDLTSDQRIISFYNGSGSKFALVFGRANNKFTLFVRNSSNSLIEIDSSSNFSLDTWYHVVGTIRDGEAILYVNGVEEGTSASIDIATTLDTDSEDATIGSYQNSNSYLNGELTDVRLYDKFLQLIDIEKIYNEGNGLTTDLTLFQPDGLQYSQSAGFNEASYVITPLKSEIGNLDAVSGNPFTVCGWFKSDGVSDDDGAIFGLSGGVGGSATFVAWLENDNQNLRIRLRGSETTVATDVTDGEWHFLAIVWDGTNANAYYDGLTPTALNVGSASAQDNFFTIGVTDDGTKEFLLGQVGDVRIYNRALTTTEISTLYNSDDGFTANATGYGVLGQNKLGDNASTTSLYSLLPKSNQYTEYFGQNTFINSGTIEDLETWLTLNGNAIDNTANGYDGTWNGTEDYDTGNHFNQAANISSTTIDNIEFAISNSIINQTGTYSISCWVYQRTSGTNMNVWCYNGGGSNRQNLNISGSTIGFQRYDGSDYTFKKGNYEGTGQWVHVVSINDGGNVSLYQNTIELTTSTGGNLYAPFPSGDIMVLGYPNTTTNGSQGIDGLISDFRIYRHVLSDIEINKLYNEGNGYKYNSFSSGTLNTTNETYYIEQGAQLESEVVTKLREPITTSTMLTHDDLEDGVNVSLQLSNDSGSTWEDATIGSKHTFTSSATTNELKYRLTSITSTTITKPLYIKINN